MLAPATALLAGLLLAGCAVQGEVQTAASASNHSGASVLLVLKVWDHNGRLVYNRTASLATGMEAMQLGSIGGPLPTYGSKYSWFAQAGPLSQQEARSPQGVSAWSVDVFDDRIDFAFATAKSRAT
ncbi:MAG: hypothetical protein ABR562_01900 [Thermoplasmatota archaeon]